MDYEYLLCEKNLNLTRAQESLHAALISELSKKSLSLVTVKDVCSAAFVARSTFYAYYQNVDELLCEIEDLHVRNLISSCEKIFDSAEIGKDDLTFYSQTLEYISSNKSVFEVFLVKNPNYRFINKWKYAIKHHFANSFFKNAEVKNEDFILEAIASLIVSFDSYWLDNRDKVDINSVYPLVYSFIKMLSA